MFLKSLDEKFFLKAIPSKPSGNYAHIVILRVTESHSLFQTDGALNTARVQAGMDNRALMTRILVFKRKQATPERLTGRELLRKYGIHDTIARQRLESAKEKEKSKLAEQFQRYNACDYNVEFCMRCPDCILYGFAIGESGSEKSKVVTDTAYSITSYEDSHETLTLNAPFEGGTMSREGETTSRINSQDHVKPGVFFPSIVTLKDPTEAGFLYVLNNIRRTEHYGAQTTRTGKMHNTVLALVFADGEITSNLRLTQRTYDLLLQANQVKSPDPLLEGEVTQAMSGALAELLRNDGVNYKLMTGEDLKKTLDEANKILSDEAAIKGLLEQAFQDSKTYFDTFIGTK
jgi:CRISPR-associated protein Csc2